ncbi:aldo/keto reductase [Actinopolymorpha alba]|uniref:aldo/keto reductase n=1 Tax=Actinopolymorpha alba TaxID=533267 RepID=UPI00037EAD83|nr:aldo/keto reductase [Actinopolymorpha alba]
MEYELLGRSGAVVSRFGLGAMGFGDDPDEETAFALLDGFVAAGGTLVDTADVYGDGRSEQVVGRWLASRPADVTTRLTIATKGRYPSWAANDPAAGGLSRQHLSRALDASLRRLGVETIDLYQAHAWDPLTPLEETLAFLDAAVRQGKIRYYGLSNFTGWQLQKTVERAAGSELERPVTLQLQYNLLARQVEWEITPSATDAGLGLLPWSPLAGGLLTGKYEQSVAPAQGTRFAAEAASGFGSYFRSYSGDERTWTILGTLREVAAERGVTPAEVALAWVADRPGVSAVIVGARTLDQLDQNLRAAELHLDPEETARLDSVSEPAAADYPYGAFGSFQRSRTIGPRPVIPPELLAETTA